MPCFRSDCEIKENEIIFLHYLLRNKNPNQCKGLIDENPFLNLIGGLHSQPNHRLLSLDEALSDLDPLKYMAERKNSVQAKVVLLIIFLISLIIFVTCYIYFITHSHNVTYIYYAIIIYCCVIFSATGLVMCLNVRYDNKYRTKIIEYLDTINREKYFAQGKEWFTIKGCLYWSKHPADYIGIRCKTYFGANNENNII